MDRLTDKEIKCMAEFCEAKNCLNYERNGCCGYERYQRLAAYEDTGLSPEEIENTLADFSAFLCYMTNGRMSKTNYTVEAMRSEADSCIMEMCDECEDRQFAEKYEKAEAGGRLIVPQWVSVKDRLPEAGEHVIACDKEKEVCEAILSKDGKFYWSGFWGDWCDVMEATHWMPMPEPPKEKAMADGLEFFAKRGSVDPLKTYPTFVPEMKIEYPMRVYATVQVSDIRNELDLYQIKEKLAEKIKEKILKENAALRITPQHGYVEVSLSATLYVFEKDCDSKGEKT